MKKVLFCLFFFVFCLQSFSQKNLSLLGNLTYSTQLSNLWGYVDDQGNEYALVGTKSGFSIVDVSTPTNPVEVKSIQDTSSIWREVRVWNKHAYVTNETGNGLLIVDLSSLPNASGITYSHYTGNGMATIHTIFIDENGIAYAFGTDVAQGALILDLSNPASPTVLGAYTDYYIHDGYVRGDTLWAGAIYEGKFLVVDMSDKSAPKLLASQTTPGVFTHNCALSDNGKYLFTTDEVTNSYITSYDVSDLSNITELDRNQSNPGSNAIVHNTYVVNTNFLVNAYYKDGVTIVDATHPDNMIQVGNYDTYSQGGGDGMEGCWGVYPYLPSGNILASDMQNGLFIFQPSYIQACYLEGKVSDKSTTAALYGVSVEILTSSNSTSTGLTGEYATGIADAGSYDVVFSKSGYYPDTVNVSLNSGVATTLNVELEEKLTYTVSVNVKDTNGNSIEGVYVSIVNNDFDYSGETDTSGTYQSSGVYDDEYSIVVGQWGYITQCLTAQDIPDTTAFSVILEQGYYDDFSFDYGWTESGAASTGNWERGEPIGTDYLTAGDANPEYDSEDGGCSDKCFVTGNAGGSSSSDDVDNSYTLLSSPGFDLTSYSEPYVSYARWFFNKGGFGNPDDTLIISLNNGITTAVLEMVTTANTQQSTWVYKSLKVSDYITPTSNMQLTVYTADQMNSGHLVEAGFDIFEISDSVLYGINQVAQSNMSLDIYPNPVIDDVSISYALASAEKAENAEIVISNALGQEMIKFEVSSPLGNINMNEKLSSGIYFVSLRNAENRITKAFIKK